MYTRGRGSQRDLRTRGDVGEPTGNQLCNGRVLCPTTSLRVKAKCACAPSSYDRETPKALTAGASASSPLSSQTVSIPVHLPVNSYTHLQVNSPKGPLPHLCFRVPSPFPHTKQLRGCGRETRHKREPGEGAPEVYTGTCNGIQSSVIPTGEVQSQPYRTPLALPVALPSGLSSKSRGNSCSQHEGELNCRCCLTFPLAPFAKLLRSAFLLRSLFLHLLAIISAHLGADRSVPFPRSQTPAG